MTKQERAKLSTVLNAIVARYLQDGHRITTSQVVADAMQEAPDLVAAIADQLINAAMSSMVNQHLKRANRSERESMQVSLFGNREPGLTIPKSIALPSADGSREMIWVATTHATIAELDGYLKFLSRGIKADQRKYQQVRTFRDSVVELADSDDSDTPISEMLEGLRAKRAKAI